MCRGEKNVSVFGVPPILVFSRTMSNEKLGTKVTPKKSAGGFSSCCRLCSKVVDAE